MNVNYRRALTPACKLARKSDEFLQCLWSLDLDDSPSANKIIAMSAHNHNHNPVRASGKELLSIHPDPVIAII